MPTGWCWITQVWHPGSEAWSTGGDPSAGGEYRPLTTAHCGHLNSGGQSDHLRGGDRHRRPAQQVERQRQRQQGGYYLDPSAVRGVHLPGADGGGAQWGGRQQQHIDPFGEQPSGELGGEPAAGALRGEVISGGVRGGGLKPRRGGGLVVVEALRQPLPVGGVRFRADDHLVGGGEFVDTRQGYLADDGTGA